MDKPEGKSALCRADLIFPKCDGLSMLVAAALSQHNMAYKWRRLRPLSSTLIPPKRLADVVLDTYQIHMVRSGV